MIRMTMIVLYLILLSSIRFLRTISACCLFIAHLLLHFSKKARTTSSRKMYKLFLKLNLIFIFFLHSSPPAMASFDDYTAFVYVGCSQSTYTIGTSYQSNVDSLLTSFANAAAISSYNDFTSNAASAATPAYGLFQCRTDLSLSDCASCVRTALGKLSSLCPSATGAGVQLKGCFIRYSDDSFLGKPDTTLFYKKCGSSVPAAGDGSSGVLSMRDAALSGLSAGGGSYRVSSDGRVRALAQCVGDQSSKQCSDCVASAVKQLKDVCGGTDGGDAYLGKCQASYWFDGVDASNSRGTVAVSGLTLTGSGLPLTAWVGFGLILLSTAF